MKIKRMLIALIFGLGLTLALVWLLSGGLPAHAAPQAPTAELHVCPSGCAYSSIQSAVDAANPGDVIKVAQGDYTDVHQQSGITQVVYISKTVTIRGGYSGDFAAQDPDLYLTTLDAQGLGRVMVISGTITPTIEGLRITGGDATGLGGDPWENDSGGGVYLRQAAAIISNCTIYSNTASATGRGYGGGLYLRQSDATLTGNTVFSNTASTAAEGDGGGLYLYYSNATLTGNTVLNNVASTANRGDGGGLYLYDSNATLEGNTVQSNTASTANGGSGGGLYLYRIDATLEGNTVLNNTASTAGRGSGGGLLLTFSNATLSGNTVLGNIASTAERGSGGGLYLYQSGATLSGNTVFSNTASTAAEGDGGGLYLLSSAATLSGNTVLNNTGSTAAEGDGGGLSLSSSAATLTGNTVRSNTSSTAAEGYGGGLILSSSDATLEGNTVLNNTASTADWGIGGGLYLYESDATLSGNTVQANTASTAAEGYGGGLILSSSAATLTGNTVLGNIASIADDGYGGGLHLDFSDATTLEGNTIVSNTATLNSFSLGQGGGVFISQSSPFTLTNNLVAGNQANTQGSGLWFEGWSGFPTSVRLLHTTIADNHGSGQGVYVGDYTTLAFTNTIVSGHGSVGITVTAGSTVTLAATLWHSNGTDTGGGGTVISSTNVYGDPAFADPAVWDYHITAGSAAIDAGVDAGVTTDLDGDPRPQGDGYDVGADEAIPVPVITLTKSGPEQVGAGEPITYTLTVTNSSSVAASTLVITDALPAGAVFVAASDGGLRIGDVVSWTVPSLGPTAWLTRTFTVTATATITNSDYRVSCAEGVSAAGSVSVVTNVIGERRVYLPLVLRNFLEWRIAGQ